MPLFVYRTTSPPGEPLVRAPVGKPRCPPAISRLRVEKVEGGLAVAGVVVAANCQIILPIFGFLFMLVGCVLTAASYRGCGENEEPDHYAARIAFTGNSRVLGPVCIVAGALMTLAGIVLCMLMRAAQRRQRRLAFHCPIHGDFYPLSPQSTRKYSRSPGGLWRWLRGWLGMIEEGEAPRCPRSTEPASPARADAPCPPPLPFLVPSDSVVGMASVLGAPLSPEQTFGSIKSLAISREVASFPLSRSPTPPPMSCPPFKDESKVDSIPNAVPPHSDYDCGSTTYNYRVVECKLTTTDEISRSAPSSAVFTDNIQRPATVCISIPNEGKG
ncbi:jg16251 [Pararge aegeria aegeria]|uniref:Jg16251 protein n=1 Tax=Pararge aegeria aegeria TaxID=348720 RepID=A0A8S4RUV5_9NEOP|nr:jg16251 [Pararge aegeria aegeria]